MKSLRLPAETQSLNAAREFVLGMAVAAGAATRAIGSIELVLEELLMNVALHGYQGRQGEIEIGCSAQGDSLTLTFTDWGTSFNPLERPDPRLDADIDNRPIGGLGIVLVKKTAESIEYQRREGANILTVRMKMTD